MGDDGPCENPPHHWLVVWCVSRCHNIRRGTASGGLRSNQSTKSVSGASWQSCTPTPSDFWWPIGKPARGASFPFLSTNNKGRNTDVSLFQASRLYVTAGGECGERSAFRGFVKVKTLVCVGGLRLSACVVFFLVRKVNTRLSRNPAPGTCSCVAMKHQSLS